MKRIWLRNARKYALIDDSDWELVSGYNWYLTSRGYVATTTKIGKLKKICKLHTLIFKAPLGLQVDHLNRNGLDNRRENLRWCTHAQNQANRSLYKRNTSGYKGVSFHKPCQKWRAYIGRTPQQYLGVFHTKEDAARAYNAAAKELYGEFACLNKIKACTNTSKYGKNVT